MVPSTDDAAPTAPPPVMMLEQSAKITAWGDFFSDISRLKFTGIMTPASIFLSRMACFKSCSESA